MTALYLALAGMGFMAFLALQPKVKALVAFVLMMNFFNLAPDMLFGMYVWDYGAMLMLVTAVEVYAKTPILEQPKNAYLMVLKIFMAWMVICFVWSLLVYQYPLMHTIKSARQVMVGFSMTLIFIRLFRVQPGAFEYLMKWLYRLTFVAMPVMILQSILHKQLLFATAIEYEGVLRTVPVYLALCTLNLWILGAKLLAQEKLAVHEWIYGVLALATIALTFTRGIYAAVLITAAALLWIMMRDGRLKASSLMLTASLGALLIVVAVAAGLADKILDRAASGLSVLGSADSTSAPGKKSDDTFSGRLGLMQERFSLASAKNPIVGYGFIHEEDIPSEVRSRLKFGTPLGGTAADPTLYARAAAYSSVQMLGFYTPDIAWPNFVIATGWVGTLLFMGLLVIFVTSHYRNRLINYPSEYAVRTGLFLQIVWMAVLTLDGPLFWSGIHIPALVLAGYSMIGHAQSAPSRQFAVRTRPANLLT
jgi:O-Antigen ligase